VSYWSLAHELRYRSDINTSDSWHSCCQQGSQVKLSRNVTRWIHFLLDQCCPPLLRDSKWFMWLPFRLIFGSKARIFFEFKQRAPMLTAAEFREVYAETTSVTIDRDTDLNDACIEAIESSVVGESVLDVACGRGYLTKRLASKYVVTGVDVVLE
jgi:2-polyprenyl-3-methyl-5-hydroxy-6-metoxy-1,4-benzoquinol methylase